MADEIIPPIYLILYKGKNIWNMMKYNKEKYFLDENRNKIYAKKGNGHKNLSYDIIRKEGLDFIYFNSYEQRVSTVLFLIYGGYVLVDEAEEKYEFVDSVEPWNAEMELKKFTTVGYCSTSIDADYVHWIKDEYEKEGNIIDDAYETDDLNQKKLIDEIREVFKKWRESQKETSEEEER